MYEWYFHPSTNCLSIINGFAIQCFSLSRTQSWMTDYFFIAANWWYIWGFNRAKPLSAVATKSHQTLSIQDSAQCQPSGNLQVTLGVSPRPPSPKTGSTGSQRPALMPKIMSADAMFTTQHNMHSPPTPDPVPQSASFPFATTTLPAKLHSELECTWRCRAQTKAGHRCKLSVCALNGNLYCKRHLSHYYK